MPIEVSGWAAEFGLEAVELAQNLGLELVSEHGLAELAPVREKDHPHDARQAPLRCQMRHGRERGLVGQGEMKADIRRFGKRLEPARLFRPELAPGHATGGAYPAEA